MGKNLNLNISLGADSTKMKNFNLFVRTSELKIKHSPRLPAFKWQHPKDPVVTSRVKMMCAYLLQTEQSLHNHSSKEDVQSITKNCEV